MALFLPGQSISKLGQQPGFGHLQQQAGHLTAVLAIAQLRQQELLGRVWQRRKLTELLQRGQLAAAAFYVVGSVLLSLLAVAAGYSLGK